jgi:hypothetical protein
MGPQVIPAERVTVGNDNNTNWWERTNAGTKIKYAGRIFSILGSTALISSLFKGALTENSNMIYGSIGGIVGCIVVGAIVENMGRSLENTQQVQANPVVPIPFEEWDDQGLITVTSDSSTLDTSES